MTGAPEAAFFSVMAVLTALSLWRELPLQYVITVGVVMYAIVAVWYWLLGEPCWWLPVMVLNSRGASRLVLRKSQDRAYYGWWVMGLTCVLSTILAPHPSTPALALAMQVAALPWLIKRRPEADAASYFPLVNWLLIAAYRAISLFLFFHF